MTNQHGKIRMALLGGLWPLYLRGFLWGGSDAFRDALHVPLDLCEDLVEVLHLLVFHGVHLERQRIHAWGGPVLLTPHSRAASGVHRTVESGIESRTLSPIKLKT